MISQQEVIRLHEQGFTFAEIGKRLGVTRQAAHWQWRKVPKFGVKNRKGEATVKPSRRQRAHTTGVGRFGEREFARIMRELGKDFDDTHEWSICDFDVKGKGVEVKTSRLGIEGKWCFDFTKNKGTFDYLACCGEWEGEWKWLIIPKEELEGYTSIGVKPYFGKGWERWGKWLEKWELL